MSQPQPSTSGGAFSIDLDRAPQAIKDLEDAAEQLREIREQARSLGRIDPPARDQVSLDAAHAIGAMAVGGPESFVAQMTIGLERLEDLISSMRDELQSYSDAEADNEATLTFHRLP